MTKVIFMGTPDFAVPILRTLIEDGYDVAAVVTQPDRPVGRKRILTPPPVKKEAEKWNIPVYQPEKISEAAETDKILELSPDLIVTAAFGQLLPSPVLDAPKHGCINVHASLLPELRGGAPIHHAIMRGMAKTGITIMYMVEKLDAGNIISQVEVPITEQDDVGSLHDKLSEAGATLLSTTLPKLLAGELNPRPQEESQATYAFNITREEEKIDWSSSGEDIYNHIRGLCPWPVAYTTFDGDILKIWQAQKKHVEAKKKPGTIVKVEKDGFLVSTGNNTGIKILELQPAGKKKMSASQYLRGAGASVKEGDLLGE